MTSRARYAARLSRLARFLRWVPMMGPIRADLRGAASYLRRGGVLSNLVDFASAFAAGFTAAAALYFASEKAWERAAFLGLLSLLNITLAVT